MDDSPQLLHFCYVLYVIRDRADISVYTQGVRPEFMRLDTAKEFRIERRRFTTAGMQDSDLTYYFRVAQRQIRYWLERRRRIRRLCSPRVIRAREVEGRKAIAPHI
jgi:hypothetical protein